MGVSDIFKLALGPVDRNTATFLRVSDAEPGKLTEKEHQTLACSGTQRTWRFRSWFCHLLVG